MLVSDLPIWAECPFEIEGVDVRRGTNELGHDVIVFCERGTDRHIDMLAEAFKPSSVDLALHHLGPHKRWVRV
jgi:hypothetical protein